MVRDDIVGLVGKRKLLLQERVGIRLGEEGG